MGALFKYDDFISMDGPTLCEYMESILSDPTATVPAESVATMFHELTSYDEFHLVYALLLGCEHLPKWFVPILPKYLERAEDSVFCTALNMLTRVSDEYITSELVESVRNVSKTQPERDLADLLRHLECTIGEK